MRTDLQTLRLLVDDMPPLTVVAALGILAEKCARDGATAGELVSLVVDRAAASAPPREVCPLERAGCAAPAGDLRVGSFVIYRACAACATSMDPASRVAESPFLRGRRFHPESEPPVEGAETVLDVVRA